MISPKTVRYGNILYMPTRGKNVKVNGLSIGNINGTAARYFIGVQITKDILIKCEFEQDSITFFRRGIMLAERKSGGYSVWYGTINHGKLDEVILHDLHELQNLYYVLTGSELNPQL